MVSKGFEVTWQVASHYGWPFYLCLIDGSDIMRRYPGLLWGRQTLPRRLQMDYPLSAGRFASLRFRPKNMAHHISQLESEHCR